MVRYPLGGMMSWVLQYLTGLTKLGHEVYFVEKYGYPGSCFNPVTRSMSDNCSYGVHAVQKLLSKFQLGDNWCFVARDGTYYGIARGNIESLFTEADLFIDMGTHGAWLEEAAVTPIKVLLDGEPGYTQIRMANNAYGENNQAYDRYFTNGLNIGTPASIAPDAGIRWEHIPHPIDTEQVIYSQPQREGPFSTIMNWRSHDPVTYNGKSYGQKDVEFNKIIELPGKIREKMEVAVAGNQVPRDKLRNNLWNVVNGHEVTRDYDTFLNYLRKSKGEFSICKNVFVATNSGWFSDKSAMFLALGRPVVLQDTGFSEHLPCGMGLFAFRTEEEALEAIDRVSKDYRENTKKAREIACEYLEAGKIMQKFLDQIGIG
jgi:hypothetical protein